MRRFGLQGTPSSVLIGRDGTILHHIFGVENDLAVGARIAMALSDPRFAPSARHADRRCRWLRRRAMRDAHPGRCPVSWQLAD
jgi:hypothetical protein